jgi:protein-S-isoprenylcysteine O-methyltransferase
VIYWITYILAFGYFALELFLLATRRGKVAAKAADGGTLFAVWALIFGGCLAGFFLARQITSLNWSQKFWIVCLADCIIASGIGIRIWAIRHLGRFFTVDVGIQPGHRVVQDGPFRFVRHPSYSGSLLALAGIGCLTLNWLGLILIITCTSLAYALRIPVEEKALLAQFGPQYAEYTARTKRLIPWIY